MRTVFAGWARGDFRAGSDLFVADFEWKQRPDAVEPGSHRGASVDTALRELFEVWENYRIEPEEYIDAGDRIVVVGRARGTTPSQPWGWATSRAGEFRANGSPSAPTAPS